MMKRIILLVLLAFAVSEWLCSGCGRNDNMTSQSQDKSLPSSRAPGTRASDGEHQQSMDAVAEQYRKEARERNRIGRGLKIEQPQPNPICGPGRPVPDFVNYYEVHDDYPTYLLCTFRVNEQHYDPSNEPAWFKAALLQMRSSGPESFRPSLQWVAVIISNSAERDPIPDTQTMPRVVGRGARRSAGRRKLAAAGRRLAVVSVPFPIMLASKEA